MKSPTVYGIRQCDTMKKAFAWLDAHGVDYVFHDYKRDGIDAATLERWVAKVGWEQLLNRRGTTFRKLPGARQQVDDSKAAIALMREYTSCIRRPIIEHGETILVGFDPRQYAEALR
jgi:arsenate reductase